MAKKQRVAPPPPVRRPAPEPPREWEEWVLEGSDPEYDADGNQTGVREWGIPLRRVAGPQRPGVPKIDPGYEFREEYVREVAWAVWPHDGGLWTPQLLVGQRGCGKTSLIVQLAARCNIVVHRVNCNVGTTVRHLKGRTGARSGSTVFVPGEAVTAGERGNWLLLDEISGLTPPAALALFPILEPDGAVLIEEAEPPRYMNRHEDFRVFGTDNTIGASQEDTRFSYAGTNPVVNEALLDRFGSTLEVDYLPPSVEDRVVRAVAPDIDKYDLEGIIRVARNVRASGAGIAFSTRMVMEWARRVAAGHLLADSTSRPFGDAEILAAARAAFLNRMRSNVERDAVIEVINRVFEFGG